MEVQWKIAWRPRRKSEAGRRNSDVGTLDRPLYALDFQVECHSSPAFMLFKGHCHSVWQLYKKLEGVFLSKLMI